MKKIIFVMAIVVSASLQAQDYDEDASTDKTWIWSIGVEPSVPVGNFNDFSNFGLGGSLQGEYKPGEVLGITLNAGYMNYFGKTVNGFAYGDLQYWPVMAGLKLYMSDMAYIHGQAGAGFGTEDLGTSFWYGGGIGLNVTKAIDAELRYMGWEQNEIIPAYENGVGNGGAGGYGGHYSTLSIRLGYSF